MIFIGFPPTKAPDGTSLWTSDAADTIALSPILTPGKMVEFAPINTLSPIITSPMRYSSIKYSWAKIVVLYPMMELLPTVIFSGNIVSGMTMSANDVCLPTFIRKNVRYNQFFTLRKGVYRANWMTIKFFTTLKKETVL